MRSRGRGAAAAVVACLAFLGLHAALHWGEPGFHLADGTGYLANARWIAGVAGTTWQGPAAFYNAGWSLVVAPITRFVDDPSTLFAAVVTLNSVLATGVVLAAYAFARRVLGLAPGHAILAAAVAGTYPAVLLQAGVEWSESLYHLVFVAFALAANAVMTRPGSPWAACALALAAVFQFAVHPRGLGVVPVTGIALVWWRGRGKLTTTAAAAGLVTLAATFVAVRLLHDRLLDALYEPFSASIEGDVLERATDPTLQWGMAKALFGQVWYLTVATLGLVPLGVLHLARDRRPQTRLVLAAGAVVLAASCLQMSDGTRVDHMVYGRYVEGVVPLFLVAGAAAMLTRLRWWTGPAIAAVAGIAGALVAGAQGGDKFSGLLSPLNVVAIRAWTSETTIDVARVTLVLLAIAAGVWLVALRWRAIALGATVVVFVATAFVTQRDDLDPFYDLWANVTEIPEAIDAVAPGAEVIAYDRSSGAYDLDASNLYQLELADREVVFFDSDDEAPPAELVIGDPEWDEPGARLMFAEALVHEQALWVMPGALQDQLDQRGLLVPEDPEAALPEDGRLQLVEVDGDRVRITHAGERGVWLPVGAVRGLVHGTVRLGARWYDAAGDEVFIDTFELPRTLLPGDSVTVAWDRDPDDADLAPGTYRVLVGARQESIAWFDDPAEVTITIER